MFMYLGTAKSENEWETKYQPYFFMYIYEIIFKAKFYHQYGRKISDLRSRNQNLVLSEEKGHGVFKETAVEYLTNFLQNASSEQPLVE